VTGNIGTIALRYPLRPNDILLPPGPACQWSVVSFTGRRQRGQHQANLNTPALFASVVRRIRRIAFDARRLPVRSRGRLSSPHCQPPI